MIWRALIILKCILMFTFYFSEWFQNNLHTSPIFWEINHQLWHVDPQRDEWVGPPYVVATPITESTTVLKMANHGLEISVEKRRSSTCSLGRNGVGKEATTQLILASPFLTPARGNQVWWKSHDPFVWQIHEIHRYKGAVRILLMDHSECNF